QNNSAVLLVGHGRHGTTSFFLGEFILSRALFEQCRVLFDRALYEIDRYDQIDRYDFGARDALVVNEAVTLAHLGYIDQARSCVDEAAARVREHSFGAAFVSVYAGWVECVVNSLTQHDDTPNRQSRSPTSTGIRTGWRGAPFTGAGH